MVLCPLVFALTCFLLQAGILESGVESVDSPLQLHTDFRPTIIPESETESAVKRINFLQRVRQQWRGRAAQNHLHGIKRIKGFLINFST